MLSRITTAGMAILALANQPALAQSAPHHTISAEAQTQDFSDGYGSLHSVRLEYKYVSPDTTVVVSPLVGVRETQASRQTSIGGGATVYHTWSDAVSTRSHVFLSEDEPVFAKLDVAQDVTLNLIPKTSLTFGGRWARFYGDRDVTFASAAVRRYFRGGSVAYRLSRIDPEGQDAFLAHLVNVVLKDARGRGETRLWLSAGEASLTPAQIEQGFDGKDLGAMLERRQPLTDALALTLRGGVSSYATPTGDVIGTTLGIGLTTDFGGSN